jgi:hypothetical protein
MKFFVPHWIQFLRHRSCAFLHFADLHGDIGIARPALVFRYQSLCAYYCAVVREMRWKNILTLRLEEKEEKKVKGEEKKQFLNLLVGVIDKLSKHIEKDDLSSMISVDF